MSRPGPITRWYSALATTRVARFVSRHVSWRVDPILLRLTGGRLATTLVFPTAVLETTGARSGARRRNAVITVADGERTVIAASNAGDPRHPDWFHNLVAHPDVLLAGRPVRAVVVTDPGEQERLWARADDVFPAFARYRADAARTGRTIPLIALVPRS